MFRNARASASGLVAAAALAVAAPAAAGISFVDQFRSSSSVQTGIDGALVAPAYGFVTHLFSASPGEFDGVELEHPGPGSPDALTAEGATAFVFFAGPFEDTAELHAAFPAGSYVYDASADAADSTTVAYADDKFPPQPSLDVEDYAALQGLDSRSPIELALGDYPSQQGLDEQIVFFTIYDARTGAIAFDAPFLPRTTASVTVPADTLLPGRDYRYEIVRSNREFVASPGAEFDAVLAWDSRTSGNFSTGAICGSGPVLWDAGNGGNDHFYDWFALPLSFEDAADAATELDPPAGYGGGHLVTITGAGEQAFLEQCFPPRSTCGPFRGPCVWIGANDIATEGTWKWTEGPEEGMTFWPSGGYSSWSPGEPNDFGGVEDCGIYGWNGSSSWNDVPCTGPGLAIVEWSPARDCGDPLLPDSPKASDALFVLKTAVGTERCPLCICDTDGSGKVSASDALLTLRFAVALPVSLDCPACL